MYAAIAADAALIWSAMYTAGHRIAAAISGPCEDDLREGDAIDDEADDSDEDWAGPSLGWGGATEIGVGLLVGMVLGVIPGAADGFMDEMPTGEIAWSFNFLLCGLVAGGAVTAGAIRLMTDSAVRRLGREQSDDHRSWTLPAGVVLISVAAPVGFLVAQWLTIDYQRLFQWDSTAYAPGFNWLLFGLVFGHLFVIGVVALLFGGVGIVDVRDSDGNDATTRSDCSGGRIAMSAAAALAIAAIGIGGAMSWILGASGPYIGQLTSGMNDNGRGMNWLLFAAIPGPLLVGAAACSVVACVQFQLRACDAGRDQLS